ncbi:hypothetical protein QP572_02150 [Brevibacterium sp. UMB10442]|nr:hypothetical protein [Brevibacterium sp. UMB10442]
MADESRIDAEVMESHAKELLESPMLERRIPGVDLSDPWSPSSLQNIESTYLRDAPSSETRNIDYESFIGHGLVTHFLGRWVDVEGFRLDGEDTGPAVGIKYPYLEHIDIMNSLITVSRFTKTGNYWTNLFESNRKLLHQ